MSTREIPRGSSRARGRCHLSFFTGKRSGGSSNRLDGGGSTLRGRSTALTRLYHTVQSKSVDDLVERYIIATKFSSLRAIVASCSNSIMWCLQPHTQLKTAVPRIPSDWRQQLRRQPRRSRLCCCSANECSTGDFCIYSQTEGTGGVAKAQYEAIEKTSKQYAYNNLADHLQDTKIHTEISVRVGN